MNRELIERIGRYAEIWHNYSLAELLQDCKSEIERLQQVIKNEVYKDIKKQYDLDLLSEIGLCQDEIKHLRIENTRLEVELTKALKAKPVGEPVAWMYSVGDRKEVLFREFPQDELVDGCSVTPLYTLPPNIDALIAEFKFLLEQGAGAARYDGDEYGYQYIDNGSGSDWRTRNKDNELMFAFSDIKAILDKWSTK